MLLKRVKKLIIPALLAVVFILLTALIGGGVIDIEFLQPLCFMFHIVPFGIGFAGGGSYLVVIYYLVLWIILTFLFLGIKRLIKPTGY
jgi:hypothetical protein